MSNDFLIIRPSSDHTQIKRQVIRKNDDGIHRFLNSVSVLWFLLKTILQSLYRERERERIKK